MKNGYGLGAICTCSNKEDTVALVSDNTFIPCVRTGSSDALALSKPYQGTHDCVFIVDIASRQELGLSCWKVIRGVMPRKSLVYPESRVMVRKLREIAQVWSSRVGERSQVGNASGERAQVSV
jgi:hypothetical protein